MGDLERSSCSRPIHIQRLVHNARRDVIHEKNVLDAVAIRQSQRLPLVDLPFAPNTIKTKHVGRIPSFVRIKTTRCGHCTNEDFALVERRSLRQVDAARIDHRQRFRLRMVNDPDWNEFDAHDFSAGCFVALLQRTNSEQIDRSTLRSQTIFVQC